ncbi:MAG: DUF3306 domain-containing protein [Betaproteobacteria bacterium]
MSVDQRKPEGKEEREGEPFLSRWSRRKDEARRDAQEPPSKPVEAKGPVPQLPPLDQLKFESDYRGFLHPKVSDDMRRAALKKLFSDPHFNVMDGLDVYIDDYSKSDPIPAAMLAGLRQAQQILERAKEVEVERAARESAQAQAAPPPEAPHAVTADVQRQMDSAEPPRTAERVDARTNS